MADEISSAKRFRSSFFPFLYLVLICLKTLGFFTVNLLCLLCQRHQKISINILFPIICETSKNSKLYSSRRSSVIVPFSNCILNFPNIYGVFVTLEFIFKNALCSNSYKSSAIKKQISSVVFNLISRVFYNIQKPIPDFKQHRIYLINFFCYSFHLFLFFLNLKTLLLP